MKTLLLKMLVATALLSAASLARGAIANVALDGIAYSSEPLYANWNPSIINDGNPGNTAHANTAPADGFNFTLDLRKDQSVSSIRILPRQDNCCAERLSNFRVSLHGGDEFEMGAEVWGTDSFTDGSNPGSGPGTLVDVPVSGGPRTARWVQIKSLDTPVPNYALQMAEVQVMAVIPENEVNRAIGAIATANQAVYPGSTPAQLVDGVRGIQVHGVAENTAGFAYSIDLRTEVDINKIVLFPRQDACCPERFSNVRISVHPDNAGAPGQAVWSADLFTDGSNPGSGAGVHFDVTEDLDPSGTFQGQWVKITSLSEPPDPYSLQLSEVEVLGLSVGGIKLILTQEPADLALGIGKTNTLSVAVNAINGDPTKLTYQWLKNGSPIDGATNSTYTVGPLVATDAAAKYSVTVSHPGVPSITSREATVSLNLASGGSVSSNRPLYAGWDVAQLLNGNRNDVVHGEQTIEPGFAYTIRLGAPTRMDEIAIFPRQDACCPERLANIRVSVHDDNAGQIGAEKWSADFLTGEGENAGSGAGTILRVLKTADPDGTFEGQWIKILSLDEETVTPYALQMAEVEVYGSLLDNSPKLTVLPLAAVLYAAPGRSSTLSVNASVFNGEPSNITYQWNKNGVPIQGANNATYTTPVLGNADEGAKYSVTVGYPGVQAVTTGESVVTWDYNYARGATATSNGKLWVGVPSWNMGMLVDGDKQSSFHGDTGLSPGFAYTVNLGSEVDLDELRIYPRQDSCCADRLANFRVTVHKDNNGSIGDVVWTADMFPDGNAGNGPGSIVTITEELDPTGTFKGQWVRIESLQDPVPDYALQMTELEAIGRIQIVEAPTLSITKNGANGATITWNTGTLETSSTLLPGSWTPVEGSSPYQPPTGGVRFYRVRK